MKRRNVDPGKSRRTLKRANKFAEGVYGSSFVYLKFVLIWCLVLLADFVLEFRFEYLWPFWLLLRSVCDSFKYQGLALSVFFVCIAITSDMICFLFIPIQWLFFMASTYIWVQYIWHTDKGICLPTVSLWLLFMYIEATIRLKDLKNSFHVDLCRPFAAHCIGYPVVTLGFGFKSYVQYRLRMRTQGEVQKENEFYFELIKGALPQEQQQEKTNLALPSPEKNPVKGPDAALCISNGNIPLTVHGQSASSSTKKEKNQSNQKPSTTQDSNYTGRIAQSSNVPPPNDSPPLKNSGGHVASTKHSSNSSKHCTQHNNNVLNASDKQIISMTSNDLSPPRTVLRRRDVSSTSSAKSPPAPSSCAPSKKVKSPNPVSQNEETNNQSNKNSSASRNSSTSSGNSNSPKSAKHSNGHAVMVLPESPKEKLIEESVKKTPKPSKNDALRVEILENCVAQLRSELSSMQQCEGDLRVKNFALLNDEKSAKNELLQLRRDNDQLQNKLFNLVNNKQKDRQNLQQLEKRLKAETEVREAVEYVLQDERKKRKEDEETATRAIALAASKKVKENAEANKRNLQEMEKEFENIKQQLQEKQELCRSLEKEIVDIKHKEKGGKDYETLMSALSAMQEKNLMLEKSLSAETRLKLDLFSALGDVKRQLEISRSMIYKRDIEIRELKSRVADVLSVLPESQIRSSTPHYTNTLLDNQQTLQLGPTQHYSAPFRTLPMASPLSPTPIEAHPMMHPNAMLLQMPLDPNAAIYTPASGV